MLKRLAAAIRRGWVMVLVRRRARREVTPPLSLRECWVGIRRGLLFFPAGGISREALQVVVRRLEERFPGLTAAAVVPPGAADILSEWGFSPVIEVKSQDFTFLGTPRRGLRDRIRSLGAELALDLSPDFEPLVGLLCQLSQARLRVGFAGPGRDLAFNYQVAPRAESTGLEKYQVLARYLG